MDWDAIANIATLIGELAGAAALVSGFALYRIGKRDAYVAEFKQAAATIRGRLHKLNDLVNYELLGEVTRSVVFASELERPLKRVFREFFEVSGSSTGDQVDALKNHMKKEFPPITVAVHCPLVEAYESILLDVDSDLAKYQTDFPALHRVFLAVRTLLGNIEGAIKRASRDDKMWEEFVPDILQNRKDEIKELDALRDAISWILMGVCHRILKQKGQSDIDNALSLLDIVVDAYLALPERQVLRWSSIERATAMVPLRQTKKTTEDLREAEKALKSLLPQDDVLRFREHVTRIEGTVDADS